MTKTTTETSAEFTDLAARLFSNPSKKDSLAAAMPRRPLMIVLAKIYKWNQIFKRNIDEAQHLARLMNQSLSFFHCRKDLLAH